MFLLKKRLFKSGEEWKIFLTLVSYFINTGKPYTTVAAPFRAVSFIHLFLLLDISRHFLKLVWISLAFAYAIASPSMAPSRLTAAFEQNCTRRSEKISQSPVLTFHKFATMAGEPPLRRLNTLPSEPKIPWEYNRPLLHPMSKTTHSKDSFAILAVLLNLRKLSWPQ